MPNLTEVATLILACSALTRAGHVRSITVSYDMWVELLHNPQHTQHRSVSYTGGFSEDMVSLEIEGVEILRGGG